MSEFEICPECGKKSLINVQCDAQTPFWSCTNEDCADHAELFTEFEGRWIKVYSMLQKLKGVVDEKSASGKSRI